MPLSTSTVILERARREHYGIGAFNAANMEMVQAIVEAAEEERAPVIVQISQGTIKYAGLEFSSQLVKTAAALASVPVVLHLDHGTSLQQNILCLREGFTSLMYDGTETLLEAHRAATGGAALSFETVRECIQSRAAFEENLRVTKQVVEIAHHCHVPVEAELGKIPRMGDFTGSWDELQTTLSDSFRESVKMLQADPDMAEEFVLRSGCDSLAVACGSIHGMKQEIVPLHLSLVEEIARRVHVPLVLHGSSGVLKTREGVGSRGISLKADEGSLQEAISLGITKINVSTELQVTFLRALYRTFEKNPSEADLRKLFLPAKEALKNQVRSLIRFFGSSGKADIGPGLGRVGPVKDTGGSPSRLGKRRIEHAE